MSVTVQKLCLNVTAQQTIAAVQNQDGSNGGTNVPISLLNPAGSNSPSSNMGFQIVVKGGGSVSATAQIVVSNDGINWTNLTTVVANSATNISTGINNNANAPYAYVGAYISAISGTGASATCTVCG